MFDGYRHLTGTAEACLVPVRKRGSRIPVIYKHARTSCRATVFVFIFVGLDNRFR